MEFRVLFIVKELYKSRKNNIYIYEGGENASMRSTHPQKSWLEHYIFFFVYLILIVILLSLLKTETETKTRAPSCFMDHGHSYCSLNPTVKSSLYIMTKTQIYI